MSKLRKAKLVFPLRGVILPVRLQEEFSLLGVKGVTKRGRPGQIKDNISARKPADRSSAANAFGLSQY